jgi:hemerythrin-like domain-containing protein
MSRSIEILVAEHRLIEKVLASLETYLQRLDRDEENRVALGEYVRFFREFADRSHHGKEEEYLFAEMSNHGFSQEWGPLKVMLQEHNLGRMKVRALAEVAAGAGPLTENEQRTVDTNANDFVALLRAHIQKEDNVLYPSARQTVPAAVLEGLVEAFERFGTEEMGKGAHQALHDLAEKLIQKYPPRS